MIVWSPNNSLELTIMRKLDIYTEAGKFWNQVFWLKIKLIALFIGDYLFELIYRKIDYL